MESEFRYISDSILDIVSDKCDFSQINIIKNHSILFRFGENEITQNIEKDLLDIEVLIIKDKKAAKIRLNNFNRDDFIERFNHAMKIIEFQKLDFDMPDFPSSIEYKKIENSYFKENIDISPKDLSNIILKHIEKCKKNNLFASGILTSGEFHLSIANSKGLFAYHKRTNANFSTTVMDNEDNAGWAEDVKIKFSDLDFEGVSERAINKSILSKNPKGLPPGKYLVLLEPAAVADILRFLNFKGFSTQAYYDGTNPFRNKIGQKIFSSLINIIEDPFNPYFPSIPFDMEGMPKKKITIVKDGILNALPYDLVYAKKFKKESTGNGLGYLNTYGPLCNNLHMLPGNKSFDDLLKSSEDALLITHFHYTNLLNPDNLTITGMTRDGLYLVKNGSISHAVKNFRFTQSIIEALNNVLDVSNKAVYHNTFFGGGFMVPALKIKDFNFTSKTEY